MLKNILDYGDYIESFLTTSNNKKVKTFTFQVTDDCSLRCTYCYQINKGCNKMSFETAKKAIDYLFENRLNSDFYFCEETTAGIIFDFIGGEPLLAIELIDQIIEYCELKFLSLPESNWTLYHIYHLGSNGVDYFSTKVQNLIKKYPGLINFSITVDGCKELHDQCRLFPNGQGSYELALAAAKDNKINHNNNSTKITLSPENIHFTYKAILNMINEGFQFININCVFEKGWKPQHATILLKELMDVIDYLKNNHLEESVYISILDPMKYQARNLNEDKNYCGSTCAMLALDYQGKLYPCLRFMSSSLGTDIDPYIIGDVYKNGIGCSEEMLTRLDDLFTLKKTNQSTEECLNCPIESGCAWCTAYNYQEFGTIKKRSTYHCDMHKAASLASYYLMKDNTNNINKPIDFNYVSHFIEYEDYLKIIE